MSLSDNTSGLADRFVLFKLTTVANSCSRLTYLSCVKTQCVNALNVLHQPNVCETEFVILGSISWPDVFCSTLEVLFEHVFRAGAEEEQFGACAPSPSIRRRWLTVAQMLSVVLARDDCMSAQLLR